MKLSEPGVARVRGYLFVLDRSLQSRLPRAVARDALREIDAHINARVAETDAAGDERLALEGILAGLGRRYASRRRIRQTKISTSPSRRDG